MLRDETRLHLEDLGRFVEEELKLDYLDLLDVDCCEEHEHLQVIVELDCIELSPKVSSRL